MKYITIYTIMKLRLSRRKRHLLLHIVLHDFVHLYSSPQQSKVKGDIHQIVSYIVDETPVKLTL